jgi:hypothetical protein
MLHRACLLLAVLAMSSACSGQNPYLNEVYGDGVHAYFRGDTYWAQEQFDRAIQYGSRDPRVFYFRALLHLQNGDCFQAEQDIRTAVSYELQGSGTYDVGRALQRIQGPERLQLERMRLLAKLDISATQQAESAAQPLGQYPQQGLIPSQAPAVPESPFEIGEQTPADAADLDLDQPREQPPQPSEAETREAQPEIMEAPEDKPDPFADEAVQPTTEPAEPAAAPDQPAVEEVPPDTDDPFATDTDEDSPF